MTAAPTGIAAAASASAVIRGTLQTCVRHVAPVVSLHKNDGGIVGRAAWRHPRASSLTGRRTVNFTFTVPPGQYYLTMNNQYQMPPAARQIDIKAHHVFVTHIVACASKSVSSAAPNTAPTTTAPTPIVPSSRNGQLSVSIQASYVGAGSAAEEFGFLNVSNSACTLEGYPGVAALNVQGQEIDQARRGDAIGGPPTEVNLNPGQLAEALIVGSDGSIGTCDYFTHSFLVTPPNFTQSASVTAGSTSAAVAQHA
jgi:hypothetical protein